MMAKSRVKVLLAVVIVAVVSLALGAVLGGLGRVTAYFARGADPAAALNLVPNVPPDLQVALAWVPDSGDTGRVVEPGTRKAIESAYLRAWLQLNLSHNKGEPYGLKTYFSGPALQATGEEVSAAARQGWRIAQADSEHILELHFYSADGSIVAFTDRRAVVAQVIRDASRRELYAGETTASYAVVMFLDDGNWRVRTWVRGPESGAGATRPGGGDPARGTPSRPGFVERAGTGLTLDGQAYQVAGINYYPQATPWGAFWAHYDGATIDRDFATIHRLGLNTVRIFLPFTDFGGARPDAVHLDRLADLLTRADRHGLKVIITLFDFRAEYHPLLWPVADRHLETILTRFRDNPTILAWDLKNEPDRDWAAHGRETVRAWLTHSARLARQYDPAHLLTVGWSTPEAAATLQDGLDVLSFHYYSPARDLPGRYATLRAAAPDLPLILQEYGLPTWNSPFFPNGHTEPEQAQYYADILAALRATDTAGALAWTLYDFDRIPAGVAGRMPWQTGPQRYLGVLRADGRPKEAARLLAPNASQTVTRVPGWSRFLKPFWLAVFAGLGLCLGTGVLIARRGWLGRWGIRRHVGHQS